MQLGDNIVGVLVLIALALLIYTKQRHQTIKDTFEEIKDLFKGGIKDE